MINLQPSINFWHDLKANLSAGLWLFIGSKRALIHVRPTVLQFLFWGLLAGSANSFFSWLTTGGYGYFNTQGLISYALWPFLALISGVFLSQKAGDNRLLLMPVVLWLVLDTYVISVQSLIQFLVQIDFFPLFLDPYLPKLFTTLFVWQSLSIVWVLARELKWLWWERILVAIGTLVTLVVWQISSQSQPIWKIDEILPTVDEKVLYTQPKLLNHALENIQTGTIEQSHWYFMGVAGAAYQDVFKSEIERIHEQFDTRFNTKGRSISLINNPNTGLEYPIASKTSIEQALKEIGQKMNREQDILFLYLTSHGLEHQFQLENQPIDLEDIDPTWLRKTLDNAGIRWRVIVISACRSGSFIPALQSSDTLIITAAASDKDSFGCTHEAEYTYFGRAFFDQAMRDKSNIKDAFMIAQQTVAKWEQAQGFIPSEPQWSIGKNMEFMLPQFEKVLFPQNPTTEVNHTFIKVP